MARAWICVLDMNAAGVAFKFKRCASVSAKYCDGSRFKACVFVSPAICVSLNMAKASPLKLSKLLTEAADISATVMFTMGLVVSPLSWAALRPANCWLVNIRMASGARLFTFVSSQPSCAGDIDATCATVKAATWVVLNATRFDCDKF